MKKLMSILLLASVMCSCGSGIFDNEPEYPYPDPEPQEFVTVNIDYSFNSGYMTRAAEDVYNDFYEKCIVTKQNTPQSFAVDFAYSNQRIYSHKGVWNDNNGLCLPVGDYHVTGNSNPNQNSNVSDSVFIKFDTDLTITRNQETVTIPASYNCYLLLFKADNISSISHTNGWGEIVYTFKPNNGYYSIFVANPYYSIIVTKNNGDVITINLENKKFEKGKYYYFNDATNTFFLDPMENGSDI